MCVVVVVVVGGGGGGGGVILMKLLTHMDFPVRNLERECEW